MCYIISTISSMRGGGRNPPCMLWLAQQGVTGGAAALPCSGSRETPSENFFGPYFSVGGLTHGFVHGFSHGFWA